MNDSSENEMENQSNNSSIEESEQSEDDMEEHKKSTKKGEEKRKKVLGETKALSDEAIAEYNAKLKKTGVVGVLNK